jgi:hypothetical protein
MIIRKEIETSRCWDKERMREDRRSLPTDTKFQEDMKKFHYSIAY